MKMKLGPGLSFNAMQLIFNQLSGLIIFYVLSSSLDKPAFGQLNLALAVLLAVFNILSLGIDQLMIKKIASGTAAGPALSLYICHVLIAGLSFYGLLLLSGCLFSGDLTYQLILFTGTGKLMIFFSTPFKQIANGMERFRLLAWMSVVSNVVRSVCLLVFVLFHLLSLKVIVYIFIGGDLCELLLCFFLFTHSLKVPLRIRWNKAAYLQLLREALPQAGVVLITSALARFDWIFIGFIVSAVKLAEYSFAYKVFELATFPMLAIAPLLIPLFSRIFQQPQIDGVKLKFLIRMEIIVAALIALLLNTCWTPIVDLITAGRYGMVNQQTIFILSLGMPLLYVNNFLWTISFAQGRLKMILRSFVLTLLINITGDLILIPFYHNEGAAAAFLLASLAQTVFYIRMNTVPEIREVWRPLTWCTACALLSGFIVRVLIPNPWLALSCSGLLYIFFLLLSAQLKLSDVKELKATI